MQLHDVMVVNLVDVVTAAGIAIAVWQRFNRNAKYNSDNIAEEQITDIT